MHNELHSVEKVMAAAAALTRNGGSLITVIAPSSAEGGHATNASRTVSRFAWRFGCRGPTGPMLHPNLALQVTGLPEPLDRRLFSRACLSLDDRQISCEKYWVQGSKAQDRQVVYWHELTACQIKPSVRA